MNTKGLLTGNRVLNVGNAYLQGFSRFSAAFPMFQNRLYLGSFGVFSVHISANLQQISAWVRLR